MFSPKLDKFKANSIGTHFITIDSEKLTWSIGIFHKPMELRFDEIASYKVFIGETHFYTKSGDTIKFKTHQILDKEKHDEFFEVLEQQFAVTEALSV